MDSSSLEELVFDAAKCSKLSMEQKRQLVYDVARWSDSAVDILHAWSRQEILQILCSELGKERKYTGFTKSKIIEQLLKIVLEKQSQEQETVNVSDAHPSSENSERTPKRQRKSDDPNHPSIAVANSTTIAASTTPINNDSGNTMYCKNSACKAKMGGKDVFCKRCSCCICHRYDDNKDPSLWLICNSDPPFRGTPCGMSCHLECALRHESSGISKDREDNKGLDGIFCCASCGKVNDLLGSWRKQIVEARDTRRVDILCYRLSLAQKILAGTSHWQNLCEVVDEAVNKLQEEVGPLTGLPVKKARGIVNRLSSGPEIQKMCASAVESLDSILLERLSAMPSDCNGLASDHVRFEDISASSVNVVIKSNDSCLGNVVNYTLWHRKADDAHYPPESTCRLFPPDTRFQLAALSPDTDYFLKIVAHEADNREMGSFEYQFRTDKETRVELLNLNSSENERSQSPVTNCSMLSSNPSSVEDETNNHVVPCSSNGDAMRGDKNQNGKETTSEDVISLLDDSANNLVNKDSSNIRMVFEETSTDDNGSNNPDPTCSKRAPCHVEPNLLITPRNKLDSSVKAVNGRNNHRHKLNGKGIDVISNRDKEIHIGSSSKKRSAVRQEDEFNGAAKEDRDLEYYVKVIRRLECDGHIETSFRQKFLTWYSLRATPQEIRVVKVFIETFSNDPESLAEQLVDTFSDVVSNKRCCTVPSGFCSKLWH